MKPQPKTSQLEALFRRHDVWRGDSQRFVSQRALDSGHGVLNKTLLHQGWPMGALLEVCPNQTFSNQAPCGYSEWLLFGPALKSIESNYTVLLNPPALPFAQGLIQAGVDLDRLLIVQTQNKSDFIKSFVELARTQSCQALLAWQPQQNLSYTDLRKCLLASADNASLNVLFRSHLALQQSSPASLRLLLSLQTDTLDIEIFKQKGVLRKKSFLVSIPLPEPLFSPATIAQPKTPVIPLLERR